MVGVRRAAQVSFLPSALRVRFPVCFGRLSRIIKYFIISGTDVAIGRVAQLVRALLSHSRGPGFESLRDHRPLSPPEPARTTSTKTPFQSMNSNKLRLLAVAAFLFIAPSLAAAQTSSQAQQMLEANPDLVRELRARILSSGLTPEQVRARLRAEGYPEDLLDAYLSGELRTYPAPSRTRAARATFSQQSGHLESSIRSTHSLSDAALSHSTMTPHSIRATRSHRVALRRSRKGRLSPTAGPFVMHARGSAESRRGTVQRAKCGRTRASRFSG